MSTRKPKKDCCKSCGKKWDEHLGIEGTCDRLRKARTALAAIRDHTKEAGLVGICFIASKALKDSKP